MSGLHHGLEARLARIVPSIMLGLAILASALSVSAETVTNKFGGLSGDSKDLMVNETVRKAYLGED